MTRLALTALAALLPALAHGEPLVLAWSPNPHTPQIDVALQKGYFDAAGLEIELVSFPTGRAGFEALTGGQVDVTFMAEFPAAIGALVGQEFSVIGDLARFTGSRVILNGATVLRGGGGRAALPEDLAGRRIGTTIGTNVDYALDRLLHQAGVEAEVVSAAPSDLVPALARGDLDAIMAFPSFYSAARDRLGADYAELRLRGYAAHFILAAGPGMTGARADELDAFMAALVRADADVRADPDAAMAAVSASMQGAITPEALATIWQDVDVGLRLGSDLVELLVSEADWITVQGVIKAEPLSFDEMLGVIDAGPLRRAAPEAVDLP
ncbi:ABC transporter substrate-binding protein [Salipiger sp. 1_MG-2023]|uniref:ABC transporter substrate-binding protein n=1 Tax=Salipiger sp. 1_MG-2023 TaxID=3062665 RepID=UPI0026E33A72|nr:ABC transporter substrate-binding protein [Salipiger sp. 1_MG-2023]MDO6586708.1 ABC transporter substrate-binding protein [Salipiger sp. 1_MG-2023]